MIFKTLRIARIIVLATFCAQFCCLGRALVLSGNLAGWSVSDSVRASGCIAPAQFPVCGAGQGYHRRGIRLEEEKD